MPVYHVSVFDGIFRRSKTFLLTQSSYKLSRIFLKKKLLQTEIRQKKYHAWIRKSQQPPGDETGYYLGRFWLLSHNWGRRELRSFQLSLITIWAGTDTFLTSKAAQFGILSASESNHMCCNSKTFKTGSHLEAGKKKKQKRGWGRGSKIAQTWLYSRFKVAVQTYLGLEATPRESKVWTLKLEITTWI